MAAPSTPSKEPNMKKPRARKPNISSARKKNDDGRNVEVSMRTFEENIRGNNNNSGEKNPIIGEIMYTFKDKNVPKSDGASDTTIQTAFEAVEEFLNICTVSVTARLVTDDTCMEDANAGSSKPKKKPKEPKKILPKKEPPQEVKEVESSPVVTIAPSASDTNYSPVVPCNSQQVCADIDASELETLDGREVPLKQVTIESVEQPSTAPPLVDTEEFDLLSSRPRKKRISFYSQHKKAFSTKYLTMGETINKKEMTMHDLIFYNPTSNPMSNSQEPVKKNTSQIEPVSDLVTNKLEEEMVDDVEEEDSEMAVPQVKLSADGKIILDPKSLVVATSAEKSLKALENSAVIEENGRTINPFSKAKKKYHVWTPLETLRFYRALNAIGTDFSLMQTVFPNRTRYDLKKKFKKEERTNRDLIDKALTASADFDVDMLEEDIKKDMERAEIQRKAKEELARKKKEEKEEMKRKKKKSKSKPIKNMLDGDTGNFEKQSVEAYLHPPKKRPKVKRPNVKRFKKPKEPYSDTSEEEEPDFDSLYPSDDEPLHDDHTYFKRIEYPQRKMLKYKDKESDTESEIDIENEKSAARNENGNVRESVIVALNQNGNDTSNKQKTAYGNELIGINIESESENDIRNEEKENENSNTNDTISINEYVIISENLGENECKPQFS